MLFILCWTIKYDDDDDDDDDDDILLGDRGTQV